MQQLTSFQQLLLLCQLAFIRKAMEQTDSKLTNLDFFFMGIILFISGKSFSVSTFAITNCKHVKVHSKIFLENNQLLCMTWTKAGCGMLLGYAGNVCATFETN